MDTAATKRGDLVPGGPVKAAYDAFARRDLRSLGLLVTDDVHVTWGVRGARDARIVVSGRDRLLEMLARLVNATDGTAAADPVTASTITPDRVVVVQRERATWRGQVHDVEAEVVFTLCAGAIATAARESVISRRPPARQVP